MSKLFIIGNGFDCSIHGLPTKYTDFRRYLVSLLGVDKWEYDPLALVTIPEITVLPDGDTRVDRTSLIKFVIRIIDGCSDLNEEGEPLWSKLEKYLGDSIYNNFSMLFENIDDYSENDREFVGAAINEERAYQIRNVFQEIKALFSEWAHNEISQLNFDGVSLCSIARVLSCGDCYYLNFNYSETLEKAYRINPDRICHIHGLAGDRSSEIVFGHGDGELLEMPFNLLGSGFELDDLKRALKKDTNKSICTHGEFFSKIKGVTVIYPSGFSFSEVDNPYIEHIHNLSPHAIWFFNRHDWNSKQRIISRLKSQGYICQKSTCW